MENNESIQASENITRIFNPAGTPEAKYQKQQKEILDSIFDKW